MLKKYPFFHKATIVLFGLTLFVYALFKLRDVLVPLSFALLLAIMLNPLHNWFQRKKIKQIWSIMLCLLIAMSIIFAVVYFLSSQMMHFGEQLPILKQKFNILFTEFRIWLYDNLKIDFQRQEQLIVDAKTKLKPIVGQTIGSVAGTIALTVLLPVYTALFLYYKTLILNFLFEIFAEKDSKEVGNTLQETKNAIQNYMQGLLIEALIVATMNWLALSLLGVQYALLLGVIGALLNLIPYLGGIIAIALPIIVATITKVGFDTQIGIIAAYAIIQFIDNHFLIPVIVSSKVRINAMISIIFVLLGNLLWGIPGMFLSIPFIGVLKTIFDKIPDLKPWGKLLGDEIPTRHKGEIWFSRYRKKIIAEKKAASTTTTE
ncbi:MAG: AI-2E family transporter [Bacteroidota bacterium]